MNRAKSGITTVEGLVALTMLAAGILGAAGTVAAGLQAAYRADQTSRGVRLSGEAMARIRAGITGAGGACGFPASGTLESPTGESVRWAAQPERGGRTVLMEISYPPAGARSLDSLWSFVQCF